MVTGPGFDRSSTEIFRGLPIFGSRRRRKKKTFSIAFPSMLLILIFYYFSRSSRYLMMTLETNWILFDLLRYNCFYPCQNNIFHLLFTHLKKTLSYPVIFQISTIFFVLYRPRPWKPSELTINNTNCDSKHRWCSLLEYLTKYRSVFVIRTDLRKRVQSAWDRNLEHRKHDVH